MDNIMLVTMEDRTTTVNSFALGGVSRSADTLVVNESPVLRVIICTEKPLHRKFTKRYR